MFQLAQAVSGHTIEFKAVWYETLKAIGISAADIQKADKIDLFLRNSYVAKPSALKGLISFMNHSISIATENAKLARILATDAHYREAKKEVARRVFNSNVYFWHPFIFERLPVFYFHHFNFTVFQSLKEYENFSSNEELIK